MRDERHGRLAIRFMAVAPDLTTRSGCLGQARQAGTGADNVSLATWAVMKRACSRFYMAPLSQNPGRLKKNFLNTCGQELWHSLLMQQQMKWQAVKY